MLHSLRVEHVDYMKSFVNYLKFFCMVDLFLPYLLIYSLIYLYHMDSWMFTLYFGYNPLLLYFVAQIVPTLTASTSITQRFPTNISLYPLPFFSCSQKKKAIKRQNSFGMSKMATLTCSVFFFVK